MMNKSTENSKPHGFKPDGSKDGSNPNGPKPGALKPGGNVSAEALYLAKVKQTLTNEQYNSFSATLNEYLTKNLNTKDVANRMAKLFKGQPGLMEEFNGYLPARHQVKTGCKFEDEPSEASELLAIKELQRELETLKSKKAKVEEKLHELDWDIACAVSCIANTKLGTELRREKNVMGEGRQPSSTRGMRNIGRRTSAATSHPSSQQHLRRIPAAVSADSSDRPLASAGVNRRKTLENMEHLKRHHDIDSQSASQR